ncbi:hypothetical protein F5Y04DRAFT_200664 [Hypomontagnella monticulosa]|nr:hypothetical protein F5Y04DRAFT_200664 [Hypomontagnella monticulosa]
MPAVYGELPQHDNDDDDRNDDPSPSVSLSPAPSSSPMPFLPTVESTFTPLSIDSDFYSGFGADEDRDVAGSNSQGAEGQKKLSSTATTRTRASVSISSMVQSLSPARATRNNRSEYGLLSPETAPSSPSSSLHPGDTNSSPDPNITTERGPASKNDKPAGSNFKGTNGPLVDESQVKEISAQSHQSPSQPIIVKPKPLVRTASTKSVSLRHPAPDLNTRTSSYATNIAQLEATAEKLSMTSSIEDAIRDLHEEQKRNDSRRSSILAASIGSIPENNEPVSFPAVKPLSTASSILETNSAARYGGYSPAGFVMSPNPSLLSNPARLRSGSGPLAKPDPEAVAVMSRHGPGKSSVRSVKSASKPTLTDIAEMEPTTLTPAAMDAADRLAEEPEGDETLRIPQMEDIDLTPNAEQYGRSDGYDYWDQAVAETREGYGQRDDDNRPPTSAGSTGTYEQAERAFADFDGAHCPSDVDLEEHLFMPSFANGPATDIPFLRPFDPDPSKVEEEPDRPRPDISRPLGPPTVRPKSYLDPESGQTMLYYPARVPLMLNLPQKLSKKPKAEARDARRSQVLGKMAETNRKSDTVWLPEYLPEPSFNPLESTVDSSVPVPPSDSNAEAQMPPPQDSPRESQFFQPLSDDAHKSRVSVLDSDKRKSRMSNLDGLPPQLRASAFFDLPSEVPTVQLKDGSAMATLDSILDASAKAPVSAFTDHAFAGTLGSEVYGVEKKRKSHMKRASAVDLLEPKKRGSFLHLRKPSALSRHSLSHEERRNTISGGTRLDEPSNIGGEQDEERQRLSGSIDGRPVAEQVDEDDESDGEPLYNGPPTTLLAELQIRKQQQKLRTRPAATAFPNGLHSTLLEMDTVAQIERDARKGKKVNLAWEDPNMDAANNSEDEDTPLGLLMAVKGQGNDMAAAVAEINRPPGLMERRDMEDNEPLSRRRDRLQGREPGPIKRQSMMTLGQGLNNFSGSLRAPSPQLHVHTPEEEEIEGETLGERMRRLRAREQGDNPLPQARPVSSAFSAELLSQIGDAFKEDEGGKSQDKRKSQPKEEEETLGQRRRRLQAEREARERGMASAMLTGGASGDAAGAPTLTKRHSLADVLGSRGSKILLSDPRADAEKARQQEAARYRQDQDRKMALLRSQMPSSLSTPNLNQPGGYMAGRFNDGTGGGVGHLRTSTTMPGYGQSIGMGNGMMNHGRTSSGMGNAYPIGGAMTNQMPYNVPNGYGAQVNPSYGMQIQPPGQMDRVERWRQSILP